MSRQLAAWSDLVQCGRHLSHRGDELDVGTRWLWMTQDLSAWQALGEVYVKQWTSFSLYNVAKDYHHQLKA